MPNDACLSCVLPDCNDRDPRCKMRRLYRSYYAKVRNGQHDLITEAERSANNFIFHIHTLERKAEASEGGRPYRRGTTVYGSRSERSGP